MRSTVKPCYIQHETHGGPRCALRRRLERWRVPQRRIVNAEIGAQHVRRAEWKRAVSCWCSRSRVRSGGDGRCLQCTPPRRWRVGIEEALHRRKRDYAWRVRAFRMFTRVSKLSCGWRFGFLGRVERKCICFVDVIGSFRCECQLTGIFDSVAWAQGRHDVRSGHPARSRLRGR